MGRSRFWIFWLIISMANCWLNIPLKAFYWWPLLRLLAVDVNGSRKDDFFVSESTRIRLSSPFWRAWACSRNSIKTSPRGIGDWRRTGFHFEISIFGTFKSPSASCGRGTSPETSGHRKLNDLLNCSRKRNPQTSGRSEIVNFHFQSRSARFMVNCGSKASLFARTRPGLFNYTIIIFFIKLASGKNLSTSMFHIIVYLQQFSRILLSFRLLSSRLSLNSDLPAMCLGGIIYAGWNESEDKRLRGEIFSRREKSLVCMLVFRRFHNLPIADSTSLGMQNEAADAYRNGSLRLCWRLRDFIFRRHTRIASGRSREPRMLYRAP